MIVSISVAAKTPKDYDWYVYKGQKTMLLANGHKSYDLELEKDEKFGVRVTKTYVYVVGADDPSIIFKFDEKVLNKLLAHAKGYGGKIGRYVVPAGTRGKLDAPHSSNTLKYETPVRPVVKPKHTASGIREDKLLTARVKKTKLPGIEAIRFLFAQEILPGEVYYYYDAESVLRAYQQEKGLKELAYGKWDTISETRIERKDPGLDVEFGSARIEGKLHHLLSVIHI